jgi:hypothetical protein
MFDFLFGIDEQLMREGRGARFEIRLPLGDDDLD